jgi:hypothetical protein
MDWVAPAALELQVAFYTPPFPRDQDAPSIGAPPGVKVTSLLLSLPRGQNQGLVFVLQPLGLVWRSDLP